MAGPNTPHGPSSGIRSLRQLARDVPPPRDLWPAIAAEIGKQAPSAQAHGRDGRWRAVPSRMQWVALAAVVAALAVGIWVGRHVLPAGSAAPSAPLASLPAGEVVAAAYARDPRYLKERAELIRALEVKMKSLPPDTQNKVTASLGTIRKAITDIQAALGRDPGNALLQELLVNTYQDEMRVLTAVYDAGDTGGEI